MENQVCADVSRETFIDFCADCDRLLSACFQEKNIFAVMPADRRKFKSDIRYCVSRETIIGNCAGAKRHN